MHWWKGYLFYFHISQVFRKNKEIASDMLTKASFSASREVDHRVIQTEQTDN